MPHTTHANARLTPAGRLLLARCVVDQGWPGLATATGRRTLRSQPHHRQAAGEPMVCPAFFGVGFLASGAT